MITALLSIKKKLQVSKALKKNKKKLQDRINFYSGFIKKDDLIFDVGANVGNRLEAFITISSNIVAVEPQPNCVDIIKNKFGNKIHIEQVGLADKEGEMEMFIADESTISSFSEEFINTLKDTRFKRNNWDKKITVPITTLDTLLQKYGQPFFCKIDVEGFEYQVLTGLKHTLPVISFEYCVPEFTHNLIKCIDYLNDLDDSLRYNYSIQETMLWGNKEWLSHKDFKELASSEKFNKTLFGDIYIKKESILIA